MRRTLKGNYLEFIFKHIFHADDGHNQLHVHMAFPHQQQGSVVGHRPPVVNDQTHLIDKSLASIFWPSTHVDWEALIVQVGLLGKVDWKADLALSLVTVPDLCI